MRNSKAKRLRKQLREHLKVLGYSDGFLPVEYEEVPSRSMHQHPPQLRLAPGSFRFFWKKTKKELRRREQILLA